MPEYLAPGVYLEETSFRPRSIEGVSTSTTAFVGPTRKGPLGLKPDTPGLLTPEVITSFGEFERTYGGLGNLSFDAATDAYPETINYMAHAVKSFFDNGGSRVFIARTFNPRSDTDTGRARSNYLMGDDAAGAAKQAFFQARMPGSGLNGSVRAVLKMAKASAVALKSAGAGTLLRLGGDTPALPAVIESTKQPPFLLNNGDKLTLKNPTAEVGITFNGTQAEVIGNAVADPANVAIPADTALTVTISGHPAESIALPAETKTLAEWAAFINEKLRFGYARVEGTDRLALGTDARGRDIHISVAALPELGLGAVTGDGTGNVANLDAVTVAEINALLTTPPSGAQASVKPTTGNLVISSTDSGEAAKLSVVTDAAKTTPTLLLALGLETGEFSGKAGGTLTYHVKTGDTWTPAASGLSDPNVLKNAYLLTMSLLVNDSDGTEIIYDDLGFSPSHPRWAGEMLKETPSRKLDAMLNPVYLSIGSDLLGSASLPFDLQKAIFGSGKEAVFMLSGGNDGAEPVGVHPPAADDKTTAAYDDCLHLLEKIEDISILAAPGHSAYKDPNFSTIQNLLISHCEKVKYRIAVLDTPPGQTPGEAMNVRSEIDSTRAALYYPWVIIANPSATPSDDRIPKEIALPPSGFVSGIYARTDISRGVWKAPANEVVRGALRFENDITFGQQEVLNPVGVNCLRFFYGRGYRLWGARTASSDPEWKYVNIRRYFIYLERSIDRSTQWAVFEPNGEALWANIRGTVSDFLFNEWRSGALLGTRPEEAFFVRCDRSTMTQNDLDNGRLICLIGVAAIKPAEFVIFRIGQKTADSRG